MQEGSLSKTWDHGTANLEEIPEADRMEEPKDGFYSEILKEAGKGNNNCQSEDLFKVRSSTLCLKHYSERIKVVMLVAWGLLV